MNFYLKKTGFAVIISMTFASCVPSRMLDDVNASKLKCEEENSRLKAQELEYSTQKEEMSRNLKDLTRDVNYLRTDTSTLGTGNRRLTNLYNELSESYEKLVANNEKLLSANQGDTKKLIQQLQLTQEELLRKEDSLKVREKYLADINEKLKTREAKVDELQQILNSKESEVKLLKENVTKALLGFNNNGLTIEQKNGKVYVSLEEQLLFSSGSIIVDPKGAEALNQLAKVLEKMLTLTCLSKAIPIMYLLKEEVSKTIGI
ncbi:MAG: hypothetical protein IPP71_04320 [Bacteroidetes bacterium]|nr:hypothetical protein [Bacteroidota bacterium]